MLSRRSGFARGVMHEEERRGEVAGRGTQLLINGRKRGAEALVVGHGQTVTISTSVNDWEHGRAWRALLISPGVEL